MTSFGERLRDLRNTKGMTKKALAACLGKADGKSITKYENGTDEPPFITLLQLADLFGVSVDYLLGHETHTDPKGVRFLQAFEHLHPQDQLSILRIMSALASYGGDKR